MSVIGDICQLPNTETWTERAICSQCDPELWFPNPGSTSRDAKRVCISCPVRAQCLEYALRTDQRFGVWGGMSERDRRRLRRHIR